MICNGWITPRQGNRKKTFQVRVRRIRIQPGSIYVGTFATEPEAKQAGIDFAERYPAAKRGPKALVGNNMLVFFEYDRILVMNGWHYLYLNDSYVVGLWH